MDSLVKDPTLVGREPKIIYIPQIRTVKIEVV